MTEQLYYDDVNQFEFEASIEEVLEVSENKQLVILDKTCFYPEGGGQPADTGTIGGLQVLDVQKKEGKILHTVVTEDRKKLSAGTAVAGHVNPAWRFDYMQQHTGQHILSSALLSEAGCNTMSVHHGEEYVTIEVDKPEVTAEQVGLVEYRASELIASNLPVKTIWVSDEELSSYSLRRPSKKKGKIRLVIIEGTDCAACGGLHTETTGAVKLVKWIGSEKIRGNARLYWKIGDRALKDYGRKNEIISILNTQLSAQQEELPGRLEKLLVDNQELKQRVAAAGKKLARFTAEELLSGAEQDDRGIRMVVAQFDNQEMAFLKQVLDKVTANPLTGCCFLNRKENQANWMIGCSQDLDLPFGEIRSELLSAVDGKGGGKKPLWQGMGKNPAGFEVFCEIIRENIAS